MAPAIAVPPLYHWLPVADDEVSVVLPPVQKLNVPVIVGVAGGAVTVTVAATDAADTHPLTGSVTITVYVPAAVTTSVWLVAPAIAVPPLYHWLPVADEDVSVVLPPVQKLKVPVIVGVAGGAVTVTVAGADAADAQPVAGSVTITV